MPLKRRQAVIDARWLRTGIGRYILTLLANLKQHIPDIELIGITLPQNVKTIAPYCDRVVAVDCGIYSIAEQLRLPFVNPGASVFCAPHYNIPVLRRGPMVVTVHDLTHLFMPAYAKRLSASVYAKPMLRMATARASHIVTPSNYTKEKMVEHLGSNPEKITVIPGVVDDVFHLQDKSVATETVRREYGIDRPYFLFVGSAAPHKNLERLLVAYHRLCSRRSDAPLLILAMAKDIPSHLGGTNLHKLIDHPSIRRMLAIDDAALSSLYAGATATIVPSLEEGFGLPVAESMACGTPVLCSHRASLPEAAGDAALSFDPESEEEMTDAMLKLIDSPDMVKDLIEAGLQRAALFTRDRAASAYAEVLASVLEVHA
ncbi:glycosyltransferase involved in cell wall biosynthesis [Silvibacterium bohemicum]|uniref:Glycosyltransferase involved in cell wall biosynthesis n=1 Tax=Silvibacterium bohemicum TaxID=1577686 RepID=A0A841K8I0_9BACT|nr:glycosyltransferase family 1 protein [Silvibacterium bohemicum]MBB6146594.1 glycosyltransferase involved in cell wall biosynthesis [Silvibacterium bohemicum]